MKLIWSLTFTLLFGATQFIASTDRFFETNVGARDQTQLVPLNMAQAF